MRTGILGWIVVLNVSLVSADQCQWNEQRVAEIAASRIKIGEPILRFCEPCDQKEPEPVVVVSVETKAVIGGPWHSTWINGEEIDLAYVYIQIGDSTWDNLGLAVNCGASDIKPRLEYKLPKKDPQNEVPPSIMIRQSENPCLETCCPPAQWKALRNTSLLAKPYAGSPSVWQLEVGAQVTPLFSEEHLIPSRAVVVFPHGRYTKGDIVYLVRSLGEGFYEIWHYGMNREEDMSGLNLHELVLSNRRCDVPSAKCWAVAEMEPGYEWWVRVLSDKGAEGWIENPIEIFQDVGICQ